MTDKKVPEKRGLTDDTTKKKEASVVIEEERETARGRATKKLDDILVSLGSSDTEGTLAVTPMMIRKSLLEAFAEVQGDSLEITGMQRALERFDEAYEFVALALDIRLKIGKETICAELVNNIYQRIAEHTKPQFVLPVENADDTELAERAQILIDKIKGEDILANLNETQRAEIINLITKIQLKKAALVSSSMEQKRELFDIVIELEDKYERYSSLAQANTQALDTSGMDFYDESQPGIFDDLNDDGSPKVEPEGITAKIDRADLEAEPRIPDNSQLETRMLKSEDMHESKKKGSEMMGKSNSLKILSEKSKEDNKLTLVLEKGPGEVIEITIQINRVFVILTDQKGKTIKRLRKMDLMPTGHQTDAKFKRILIDKIRKGDFTRLLYK